jgi:hypothetical protein
VSGVSPGSSEAPLGPINHAMVRIDRLLRRLLALARSEEGMALPFAAFATAATLSLGAVAVVASTDVQQGAHRDSASKSASAAADAGASVALMRMNRYANSLTNASNQNCLGLNAEGSLVVTGATAGWCPPITETVGGATYTYRVSAMVAGAPLEVVSTGTSAGTSQRVDVTLGAESVEKILSEEGLVTKGDITGNGNPNIRVSVGSNGKIELGGNSWEICGNARHGTGEPGPETERLSCGGEEAEYEVSLPPVSNFIPTEIAEESYNSNKRLLKCTSTTPERVPASCEDDYYSGSHTATSPYNPVKRSISLSGHAVLTLSGKDYWLCKLSLSGSSELIMAADTNVRLFFDTPEDCGMTSSEPQIEMEGNTRFQSTGYKPPLSYDVLSIFMLGGPTSTVKLGGNGTNEMMLYAPETDVEVFGNGTWKGPVVANSLDFQGNATLEQDEGFEAQGVPSDTLYSRQSYIACSGTAASVPNENC